MHSLETIDARNRGQVLAEELLANAKLAERIRQANPDVFGGLGRCNRPAWRDYPNGYRVCWEHHAADDDPGQRLHANSIGPCDYPVDEDGAMRYDKRMREWQDDGGESGGA